MTIVYMNYISLQGCFLKIEIQHTLKGKISIAGLTHIYSPIKNKYYQIEYLVYQCIHYYR